MDKVKKKKLTLSGKIKTSPRSVGFSDMRNKRSVLVEKKVHRGKGSGFVSRFGKKNLDRKPISSNTSKSSYKKTESIKPLSNKSFELRKLAEQKAKKRIKNFNSEEDIIRKTQEKNKNFGSKREYKLTISRALDEETSFG